MTTELPSAVLEQCQTGIVCLDDHGKVVYANPFAGALLGQSAEDLHDTNFLQNFWPSQPNFEANQPFQSEIQLRQGKLTRHIRCEIRPSTEENHPTIRHVVTLSDQTAYQKTREERDRLMEMAAICEVMPTLLHEFKNPLACILAIVELLLEDCQDTEFEEHLHNILQEVRRMELAFDGLGTTTDRLLSRKPQPIDEAIRNACKIFERQFRSRNIHLKTDVATMPELPLDGGGIRGILFNLLNNAKQACRAGDTVSVRAQLSGENDALVCQIQDTGPGMSKAVLDHCTKIFFTTKPVGSGIGLTLCKTAVEKTGGTFEVKSDSGQGTLIRFCLPLTR